MSERLLLIEDEPSRAKLFLQAAEKRGLSIGWLYFKTEQHTPESDDPFVERFRPYVKTSDPKRAGELIEAHRGATLVLLDHQLGGGSPQQLYDHLRALIDASDVQGETAFVYGYSSTVEHANIPLWIGRRDHCANERLEKNSPQNIGDLLDRALSAWREARERTGPIQSRIWPAATRDYFVEGNDIVPHQFATGKTSEYQSAIDFYLQRLMRRAVPRRWRDDDQARILHTCLMGLVGGCARAHLGQRIAANEKIDPQILERSRGLRIGSLVLLLAAATAPYNDWLENFVWTESSAKTELTATQSPLQQYYSVLSLVDDAKNAVGMFGHLRKLEVEVGSGAAVTKVELAANAIRATLGFSIDVRRGDRGHSMLQVLRYESGDWKGGALTASISRALAALSRSATGLDQRCNIRLECEPNGSSSVLEIRRT